jgi:hypothetical protein
MVDELITIYTMQRKYAMSTIYFYKMFWLNIDETIYQNYVLCKNHVVIKRSD